MNNNSNTNSIRKEIVDKADIVNIVSQYVKLEKRGNNYIGLCPFHDDKNPSMSVSPQKKVFKCFSCGTAGDVVSFVSKIKNISNSEALREVGETVGIKVNMSQKDILKQKNMKYYNVLKEGASFYNFFLMNTIEGRAGIDYLNSRKLSINEIKRFNIGLAGDNDILFKTLTEKQYLPMDMIEVGLIRGGEKYHDVFKNRIIFPLKDLEGNIVGFSGRRFLPNSENESKYLNTNETILFKKGEILYNYSDCIQDIKLSNNVYLFEGFMDVIAAVRANIVNSVASMGTALTINQINAIKRVTKNVTLCYDSDGPGINATIKAIYLLANEGMNVNIAIIPDGKDADEYIYNNGAEKLHNCLVGNIISSMDFLYNYEKKDIDFNNYNDLEKFKINIFKHLSLFKSNILTEKVIKALSNDLNVSVESLLNDLNKSKNSVNITEIIENNNTNDKIIADNRSKENKRFEYAKQKCLKSERKLIFAAYTNKKDCLEIDNLLECHFVDGVNRDILVELVLYYQQNNLMLDEIFFNKLTEEQKNTLQSILANETLPGSSEIKILVKNVKEWPFKNAINRINKETNKTTDDLERIIEYKKKTTIIKRNKE